MKNKVSDLRNHLFEVIEMLKDGDPRMDIEKAKCISDVSQTVINSARAEVELLKHCGGINPSQFFEHTHTIEHGPHPRRLPNGGSN